MDNKIVKVASIIVPIVGAGLSLATNWLDEKKLDAKVAEKVAELLKESKNEG